MSKIYKKFLKLSSVGICLLPTMSFISCAKPNKSTKGVFTEYVRAHDSVISLGVSPHFHARSDLATTRNLRTEGYLTEFSNDFTLNGKRYNGGDKEYFTSLDIGVYIARKIQDSKGYFQNVKTKIDVVNSDEINELQNNGKPVLNWKDELNKIALKLDSLTKSKKYTTREKLVLKEWEKKEEKLINDAKKIKNPISVILVRGSDKTNPEEAYDGIIPPKHLSLLYGLDKIYFPQYEEGNVLKASYLIKGKNPVNRNNDLKSAFKNKANKVIYLKTPNGKVKNSSIKEELKNMTLDNNIENVLVREYDNWYLPFRGSAIGANVSFDNIEKDILGNVVNEDWKSIYDKSKLENLVI